MNAADAYLLAAVVVAALLVWAARTARQTGPRTTTTWVCRFCDRGFRSELAATLHLDERHPGWRDQ